MTDDDYIDRLNANAHPGTRWMRAGSPEAKEAERRAQARKAVQEEEYQQALLRREHLRPAFDDLAARRLRDRMDHRNVGAIRVDGNTPILVWASKCAIQMDKDHEWVRENWAEAKVRYERARGFSHFRPSADRPFNLGWDGDWEQVNQWLSMGGGR